MIAVSRYRLYVALCCYSQPSIDHDGKTVWNNPLSFERMRRSGGIPEWLNATCGCVGPWRCHSAYPVCFLYRATPAQTCLQSTLLPPSSFSIRSSQCICRRYSSDLLLFNYLPSRNITVTSLQHAANTSTLRCAAPGWHRRSNGTSNYKGQSSK